MVFPPNAPSYPRAIFHATCGPVHASVTRPEASATLPVAISPASRHQTWTVHVPRFLSKLASLTTSVG